MLIEKNTTYTQNIPELCQRGISRPLGDENNPHLVAWQASEISLPIASDAVFLCFRRMMVLMLTMVVMMTMMLMLSDQFHFNICPLIL